MNTVPIKVEAKVPGNFEITKLDTGNKDEKPEEQRFVLKHTGADGKEEKSWLLQPAGEGQWRLANKRDAGVFTTAEIAGAAREHEPDGSRDVPRQQQQTMTDKRPSQDPRSQDPRENLPPGRTAYTPPSR